jgi:hypothetical protein
MKGYGRSDGKMTGANDQTDSDFSIKLVANINPVERFLLQYTAPRLWRGAAVLRSGECV